MKKRYFGILFAVCMTVLLLTVTAYAAESGTCGDNITWRLTPDGILTITGTGEIPDPAPWQPLEEAGLIKYTLGGNSTTMVLTEDLTITETLQITGDTTIDLNGHTLTYAGKVPGSVIHVNTGATLTLNDSSTTKTGTITGGTGLEVVEEYSSVTYTYYYGGGVYNEGTFIMNGGTIKGCELPCDVSYVESFGGGVYNVGTFTMNGGSIDTCSAGYGGGVSNKSNFIMNGGSIDTCSATAGGGGVGNYGTFTMNGGTIQKCDANYEGYGVMNASEVSVFTISGNACIQNCYGRNETYGNKGTVILHDMTMYADGGVINGDVYLTGFLDPRFPVIITRHDDAIDYTTFNGMIIRDGGISIEDKACPYTVTFQTNGGTSVGPQHILKGQKAQKPADPEKNGCTFNTWYNGNTPWDFDTVLTESITLTATWDCNGHTGGTATCQSPAICDFCDQPYGEIDPNNHTYDENGYCPCGDKQYHSTVTFDANGGSVTPKAMTVNAANGKLTSLPTPTRRDYNFQGWFTKDGAQVTTETVFEADTTVYARWSIQSSALLPTWQEWELIDKIVEANKKKDEVEEPTEVEEPVEEPTETEPTETEPEAPVEPWNNPFSDVSETDAFYEAIKFAYENGYMNGMSDNTFAPNEGLTRGMLVTVLYRAAGAPVMDEANPFTDVAADAWYHNAVVWAKSIGLVNGMTETEFAPDAALTREQLVTIFYRYATFLGYDVSEGEDTNILSYEDFADIAEYAIPAMQWACGTGLFDSIDSNLLPQDNATRALVAMVLLGFYGA